MLTRSRPNQLSSGFTPFRNQQISGQESPFFTIPGSFQEKTRIQGQKQDVFQPKAERVRPNDPEYVGLGERSTQEPEIAVHTSRISSPINRDITPTQIEHNVDTPESNLNSNALWLQMSQFAEKSKKKFSELKASHKRMKTLTASVDKIVKTLQEGHAQLIKASKETNKGLNQVFEEQHHRKRDRYFLDQDINKLFNVYHNMMMRNHKLLTQIPGELEHAVKCRCNHNCTLDYIENTLQDIRKITNIGKYSSYKSSGFREKQPFRVEFKEKPRERVAEVTKKKNPCHNCGSTDHYSNNCPTAKKKVYAIEKFPEEESPTEDSESDSMGDFIREQSDEEQDPREEFLVEYQEETQLEIQDIQLETCMSQDTANKNL
ncbi:hypothetical protein O181_010599 [Austropuccinia psidii MF-1]|uniref:CCHC-type domain-containing protein n=1 Tax=Austropuccinia psidii MF-1 TaxID=1389203 RepID=A0A9Q3BSY5_9BASI|nr:hypothetical protein [Austropuccinia psidii MF-1]